MNIDLVCIGNVQCLVLIVLENSMCWFWIMFFLKCVDFSGLIRVEALLVNHDKSVYVCDELLL